MNSYVVEFARKQDVFPLIPCLPLDAAQQLLADSPASHFRRLLLPFDTHFLAEPLLDRLLDIMREVEGELILLHVGHEKDVDEACLFTFLRGLQTHAQQMLASVTVDCMVQNTAESLMDYAREHHIDLIVLPEEVMTLEGAY